MDAALKALGGGIGKQTFMTGIQNDVRTAAQLAAGAGLHFEDPLFAVYHFRKHGSEFPKFIQPLNNGIEVYLGDVRDHVFDTGNLREVWTGVSF